MKLRITATGLLTMLTVQYAAAQKGQLPIYRNGWIDFNKNGKMDIFEDPSQTVDARVKDLLSQMTLDEKTCQMATLYGYGRVLKDEMPTPEWKNKVWKDGIANIDEELNSLAGNSKAQSAYSFPFNKHAAAINTVQKWFIEETRLGIPVDFTNEGIHGLNHDRATPLPAPIGIGSTWNRKLVHQAGEIAGREAKLLGYTNVYAPILDPARDPRWGRVVECYGEDPFLIAEMGKQMVIGIQSQGVASTLKHFAVYSIPKGGRDGNARTDPHVAPREMYQIYLYPFRRVIQEAKPMGVMSSYNDWDGEPVTGSYFFLTELLRQKFGFDGYVVSDSDAVEYLFSKHHVAATYKEAVRQTVEAGLNVRTNFTPPEDFITPLRELVKEGKVNMKTIDSRVSDVLRVKFRLGLFDKPYVDEKAADKGVHTPADDSFALQLNRESLVLLKNENNTLPINKQAIKKLLVTGPMATAVSHANSRYGPSHNPVISVLEGIRKQAGKGLEVTYAKGCDVVNPGWPGTEVIPTPLSQDEQNDINEAVAKAKEADVIVAVVGEDDKRVGESLSRTSLDLPGRQLQLLQALHATGKPVVAVLINGQPLTINWENQNLPAILEAWFPGPSGGIAVAEALFGDYNPGGRLTVTFPKSTGQLELNFPYKPGSHADQPSSGNNGYGRTSVNGPLYPFGYGLSYTTFEYSNLVVTPDQGHQQTDIQVSVDVTNTGKRTGDEVVQLYMHDKVSSVTTYVWQLRGFDRVTLAPGEKKTMHFTLHPDDLALLDKNMNWTVEPGDFEIAIGANSEDLKLKKTITIID
ncbi:glycoside hydrolase family 3 N-terminal domain-containing protein [Chitinophaga sp. Cy-1792]|uniref:glycoside hydrolase family 3 N-terminal domain-containing protein n=1 Tax=Chitinophaga sp. Cy-1792 TaxID=2608339 RepID=UPI0014244C30|nr:glycoside hydrolase family 3 N-terminal domain-containing protein [Chitinophaga sp. Cy-1792]NIG56060.1 beta-glucosidase [Chitinophaga sp. Cy-1792]